MSGCKEGEHNVICSEANNLLIDVIIQTTTTVSCTKCKKSYVEHISLAPGQTFVLSDIMKECAQRTLTNLPD